MTIKYKNENNIYAWRNSEGYWLFSKESDVNTNNYILKSTTKNSIPYSHDVNYVTKLNIEVTVNISINNSDDNGSDEPSNNVAFTVADCSYEDLNGDWIEESDNVYVQADDSTKKCTMDWGPGFWRFWSTATNMTLVNTTDTKDNPWEVEWWYDTLGDKDESSMTVTKSGSVSEEGESENVTKFTISGCYTTSDVNTTYTLTSGTGKSAVYTAENGCTVVTENDSWVVKHPMGGNILFAYDDSYSPITNVDNPWEISMWYDNDAGSRYTITFSDIVTGGGSSDQPEASFGTYLQISGNNAIGDGLNGIYELNESASTDIHKEWIKQDDSAKKVTGDWIDIDNQTYWVVYGGSSDNYVAYKNESELSYPWNEDNSSLVWYYHADVADFHVTPYEADEEEPGTPDTPTTDSYKFKAVHTDPGSVDFSGNYVDNGDVYNEKTVYIHADDVNKKGSELVHTVYHSGSSWRVDYITYDDIQSGYLTGGQPYFDASSSATSPVGLSFSSENLRGTGTLTFEGAQTGGSGGSSDQPVEPDTPILNGYTVDGSSNPAANGNYLQVDDMYGAPAYKHTSRDLYICKWEDGDFWLITELLPNMSPGYAIHYAEGIAAADPSTLDWGAVSVTPYSGTGESTEPPISFRIIHTDAGAVDFSGNYVDDNLTYNSYIVYIHEDDVDKADGDRIRTLYYDGSYWRIDYTTRTAINNDHLFGGLPCYEAHYGSPTPAGLTFTKNSLFEEIENIPLNGTITVEAADAGGNTEATAAVSVQVSGAMDFICDAIYINNNGATGKLAIYYAADPGYIIKHDGTKWLIEWDWTPSALHYYATTDADNPWEVPAGSWLCYLEDTIDPDIKFTPNY